MAEPTEPMLAVWVLAKLTLAEAVVAALVPAVAPAAE